MKNIAEILKNCPKGTKLYSPICGECELDIVHETNMIAVKYEDTKGFFRFLSFESDGTYRQSCYGSECLLFPSKENRDWDTFQKPFKDGDVLFIKAAYNWILIYKDSENKEDIYKYAAIPIHPNNNFITNDNNPLCYKKDISNIRFATEEEKQKLFDAIKENSYKWDAETKTLEKLIIPKFKVGDRIKDKYVHKDDCAAEYTIREVRTECYKTDCGILPFENQDNYKLVQLVPNKFDISTLKPFDKVLVKTEKYQNTWIASFFSHKDDYEFAPFWTVSGKNYQQCIPFEGNEHLVGTTNDCNEYYKNW